MPWTNPETFTAGQTLTAASMNAISDNTEALQLARVLGYVQRTTVKSSSSSTADNVFTTDVSITADGTSAYRVEWFFAYADTSTAAVPRLVLEHTDTAGTKYLWVSVSTTNIIQQTRGAVYVTPAAGTFTTNMAMTNGGSGGWTLGMGTGVDTYAPGWLAVYGPTVLP